MGVNALSGLSCYMYLIIVKESDIRVNALSGLSCYGKNVQYFKFFMMLFMHTCYLYFCRGQALYGSYY